MSSAIPPLEKKVIGIAILGCIAHLGLISYAAFRLGIAVPGCVTNVRPFTQGQVIAQSPKRYEVHLLTKMWAFEPATIRVPVGSTVDFYVTSLDVTHGVFVDRTNVNLMSIPNVVNYARARFKKPGRYPVLCHEYCGTGHQAMYGVVEVTDN